MLDATAEVFFLFFFLRRKVARLAGGCCTCTCTCAPTRTGLRSKSNNTSALQAKKKKKSHHRATGQRRAAEVDQGRRIKVKKKNLPHREKCWKLFCSFKTGDQKGHGVEGVRREEVRLIRVRAECCHHPKCHFTTTTVITLDFHAFLNIIN